MIQNYQNDPLMHNYLAPSYPIFIQLKSYIHGLATKKTSRNVRSEIMQVLMIELSSRPESVPKEKDLHWLRFWKPSTSGSLKRNLKPV